MFRNLRIGTKLFMGFGILVILFGIIGIVSWTKMAAVQEKAQALKTENIPRVELASRIKDSVLMAQNKLDLYGLTWQTQYLESGRPILEEARKTMGMSRELGIRSGNMALQQGADKGLGIMEEQKVILGETESTVNALNLSIDEAGQEAKAYMDLCYQFLASQNEGMKKEIDTGALPLTLRDRLHKITLVNDIVDFGNNARFNTAVALLYKDPDKLGLSIELLQKAKDRLDELKSITLDASRREMLERVNHQGDAYVSKVKLFREQLILLNTSIARLGEQSATLSAMAEAGSRGGMQSATEIADMTAAEVGSTLKIVMIVIGMAILLAVIVAFVITRMITRPLKTVVELSERAGSGDLTFGREDFHYDGGDELGQMADALAAMIEAQRESVKAIILEAQATVESAQSLAALSEETNASVEEVKSAVEQVANMSEANSAALEETNAGVQEVSTSATTSAQASAEGASVSAKTIEVAKGAVDRVNNVIDDIQVVGDKSKDVERTIEELGRSVQAISGFVNTITGIADQTNLLALNAAIEAARAGDAGRGFAVVADEVRKLAEESGKAAHEVGILITSLQDGASKALHVTGETGQIMGKTVTGAREAQEQLSAGLAEIAKIADLMQDIAAGAQEQAAAAEQMAAGVDQVSTATVQVVEAVANIRANSDETAKASEGVAEHAQALTEGAERMQGELARFKVDGAALASRPAGE